MIIEANSVPRDTCLRADVCVVGAGAAGIPLALALSRRGVSVLLLESGHLTEERETQALYKGEVVDERLHSPPHRYRQRQFGGTTATWGGRCVPLDPIDFETRDYLPGSGWPFSYEDVARFYPEANELAEAGAFCYDADHAFEPAAGPLIKGFSSAVVRTNSLERFSLPTNFAIRYNRRMRSDAHVRVVLGANCTSIRLEADRHRVRELQVASLQGNRFTVASRFFVLAAGGLENARLLLASRDVAYTGVGNEHDVVGRYYLCHIAANVGTLTVRGPTSNVRHGYEIAPGAVYCRRRLSVVASEQRRLGLANMIARLHFSRITDPAHRNGVLSGLFLSRKLISYEYGKRLHEGVDVSMADYGRHLRNVILSPVETSVFLGHWLAKRTLAERKFPSVILRNRTNRFSLEINSEHIPQASSRVSLGRSVDALGMPRLLVDWRYDRADIESVGRTLDVFAAELERSGVAMYEYNRSTLEEDLMRFGAYGGHHIGTARMGSDVRSSVVDRNCQVHSVTNLFVTGSAVFPTGSQANPTLTIIALSLRLAEHLGQRMGAVARTPATVEQ